MQPIFQQGDFDEAARHVAQDPDRNALGVCLSSGHVFQLRSSLKFNGRTLSGTDGEGSAIYLDAYQISAFLLLSFKDQIEEGVSEELEAWNIAFMELRAAADESEDPRVKEAAARLDRIEADDLAAEIRGASE